MAGNIGVLDSQVEVLVLDHAPSGLDFADPGDVCVDLTNVDAYIACGTYAGLQVWIPVGGGSGAFNSLTVNPGNVLIPTGNLGVSAGTVTIGAFGRGLVFSSAAGVLSSSAGTNGQLVIGATGASPLWASLASSDGSVGITVGANSIDLTVTGATGSSFPTDAGIATPVAGATTIAGDGTNITTAGVGGTVTISLANSVSVTGKLTAGNDLEMTTGTCLIASDDNAANAIYLHANGGVNETINIYSQLGTTATSLNIHSAVGGITIAAGTALALSAASASTIALTNAQLSITTGTGALNLGADAADHTVTVGSIVGASRLLLQSGTGDLAMTSTDAITVTPTGVFDVNSGGNLELQTTGGLVNIATDAVAATVSIGNSTGASSVIVDCGTGNADFAVTATAHQTRIGSTTGASNTTVQCGTGALVINGGGVVTLDAVGNLELNTSTGAINIGTDAVAVVTTIGNVTGASSIDCACGTGAANFAASATDHTTIVGSVTGVSASTLRSGTGLLTLSSLGAAVLSAVTTLDIDTAGALSINSSAGVINIGNDAVAQNINIGTGAAARTIIIGNNTTTTGIQITSGTNDIALDSADAITIGAAGAVTVDAVGVLEFNSSGAAISIGNDANAFAINIGTGAAARVITIGNNTTTTGLQLTSGTGDIALNSADAISLTGVGAIDIDTAGVVSINSTAGALNIGNDANAFGINIGTGAAARTIIIGNNTTTTGVQITAGTGEISCNTDVNLTTAGTGFVLQEGPKIIAGSGTPQGTVTAPKGTLYLNTAGSGAADRAYINIDGTTNWTNLTTAA